MLNHWGDIIIGFSTHLILKKLTLKIVICKTDVINDSSYIKLPKFIADKAAAMNIDYRNSWKNDCFAWCIMAHLESSDTRFSRHNSMDSYTHYRKILDFKGIDFPTALKDIPSSELNNKIFVNVYQLSKANHIYPVYVTSKEVGKRRHVNLLLSLNGKKSHYCYIRYLSRLLSSQVTSHKGRVFVCNSCFHCFHSQKKLDIHKKNCSNKNLDTIVSPNDENKILKFKNFYEKEAIPCVIYIDTECLLKLCDHKLDGDPHLEVNGIRQDNSYPENEGDPISKHDYPELEKSEIMKNSIQKHEAYSIGSYYHDRYEEDKCFYDKFRGLNCVRKFAERLKEIAIQIQREIEIFPPIHMTEEDEESFLSATVCHICGETFQSSNYEVRDHLHKADGRFRGQHTKRATSIVENSSTFPLSYIISLVMTLSP
ncbi:hypothetical protein QAD02_008188 [Eretmocerus hayati]|uniref:Uncharacterized protein n=1 Tax=Eretmocerus hayati TaxID=131215 RepID=A0ACC2N6L1_9HYME|nr:hypothetical protein QAD02_008188 [Eretmocerus hayati]